MKTLQELGRQLWERWQKIRLPHADAPPLTLQQRRIYVLPTTAGMLYAATLLLMLVGSINYNLSLGYALTFLLAGLGVVAIVQSFRNLAGLQLAPARHAPGFAGGKVHFGMQLSSRRPRPGLLLQLAGGSQSPCHVGARDSVDLPLLVSRRGWQSMPRLTVSSTWPLGLVRAWSYARFDAACLVYPAPAAAAPPYLIAGGVGKQHSTDEPEDFFGLRPHRNTDLLQHVAWKVSARLGDQLLSKQFASESGATLEFDLARTPAATLEEKLAILTRWVLDAHAANRSYGLRLAGQHIAPGSGPEHLHACLRALALHR